MKNSGQKTLNYAITDNADWLSVEPSNGSSTGQLVEHIILVNKNGLAAQEATYSATITISCPEAYNNPQKVNVNLKITREQGPEIGISPSEFVFASKTGSNPPAQTLTIKNSGAGSLAYTITSDSSWLTVNPDRGTSTAEEKSHTVSIAAASLAEGTYLGQLTLADPNASNSPLRIKVSVSVSKEPPPLIGVSSTQLTFSATAGQNPSAQTLGITNSGGGILSYGIAWDAAWLSVTPSSGTSSGQQNSHLVNASVGSLSPGSYSGTISITASNASNSPLPVIVRLEIGAPATDNEITISASPNSGGTNTIVTVPVSIKGNLKEISGLGLDFVFDSNCFEYQGISKGSLTDTWTAVDGNLVSAGTLRVGGFAGAGTPIPPGSTGTIAVITLKVTGTGYSNGQQSQLSIMNYADDIVGMRPEPSSTTFTYRK